MEIKKWQIKRLWGLASKNALSKEDLYAYCNTDSLHKLSYDEANRIIKSLSYKPYKKPYKDYKKLNASSVPGMISKGQKKKVWALMYTLKSLDDVENDISLGKRLCAIIKKELGIDALQDNPFLWVEYDDANKLIEVIKKYVQHKKGGI